METKFEIGDVVNWPSCGEYTVTGLECSGFPEHIMLNGRYAVRQGDLTLVRRASAQREGGFAVGQRVRVKSAASRPTKSCFRSIVGEVGVILELSSDPEEPGHNVRITEPVDRDNLGCWYVHPSDLEPADPAPAQQDSRPKTAAATGGVFADSEAAETGACNGVSPSRGDSGRLPKQGYWTDDFEVGQRVRISAQFTSQADGVISEVSSSGVKIDGMWFGEHEVFGLFERPPQPAPMTRAARVLAKMEQDPYEQARNKVEARIGLDTQNHLDHYTATATDNEPKQQAARLRMAKMSLDRPLDAELARWERLVLAKVPVGRR